MSSQQLNNAPETTPETPREDRSAAAVIAGNQVGDGPGPAATGSATAALAPTAGTTRGAPVDAPMPGAAGLAEGAPAETGQRERRDASIEALAGTVDEGHPGSQ